MRPFSSSSSTLLSPGALGLGVAALALPSLAAAARLEVADRAPAWLHLGADALLALHVGGGALGLLAGTIACLTRKGGPGHRTWGRLFVAGMSVTYVIGAGTAPFLDAGQRPNLVAGVLALYLLATGVVAARRRHFVAGRAEGVGAVVAVAITLLGVAFMIVGATDPSGTVDGSPPQAFVVFVAAGAAAATGDLRALAKRTLTNAERTARHLWRMCASFFIASGSLFFGQPQVFPAWFAGSALQALLAFGPLLVMLVWLARERWGGLRKEARVRRPHIG